MRPLIRVAVVLGALVAAVPFVILLYLMSLFLPAYSVYIGWALCAAAVLYFWLRGRAAGPVVSESSLMGRHHSKEGLL